MTEGTHWTRLKDVVADALELAPTERLEFLATACGDDAALRAEVEELLAQNDEDADTVFDRGALAVVEQITADLPLTEPPLALGPGVRIGRYTLGRLIGEGGMGRVFEATQEHPKRTVALKVMRPHSLAIGAEQRFHWEAEALGRLGHPAVAQVFEAGVEALADGSRVPWFAMQRIEGRPLHDTIDDLDREQRIRLFLDICDGVAHAHRRGVIHRDLKPDNILVDAAGKPHIVDFGIARAVDDDERSRALTLAGEVLGTLAYMSPEQVLGDRERIDARTDVYALGVILFEMLTGQSPHRFETGSLAEAALKLTREDARLAGSLDRTLKGDFEAVLAAALARESELRYPTVDAFADDVRRIQRNEPVRARAQTTLYQLSRFARRHRKLVIAVAGAFVLLTAGIIGTAIGLVQAQRARDEATAARARAETERDRAQAANEFLRRLLASADPEDHGRDIRLIDWLDMASAELAADETLEESVQASLRFTIGYTNWMLGRIEPASEQLEYATVAFDRTDGRGSPQAIEARGAWCEVALELGDLATAEKLLTDVRAAVANAAEAGVELPDWAHIRPFELEAELLDAKGEAEAAVAAYRRCLAMWLEIRPDGSDQVETARNNLAIALLHLGKPDESLELMRETVTNRAAAVGPDHAATWTARCNLASALGEIGDCAAAVALCEEIEDDVVRVFGPDHPRTLSLYTTRAVALGVLGRDEEALPLYRLVRDREIVRSGDENPSTLTARNNLAVCLATLGRIEEAVDELRSIHEVLSAPDTRVQNEALRINTCSNLASLLSRQGRHLDALPYSTQALKEFEELLGEASMQTLIARNNHVTLCWEIGRFDEAVELAERNLALAERNYPDHPYLDIAFRQNLARSYRHVGRTEDALPLFEAAWNGLSESEHADRERLDRYATWIVECLESLGRIDEAEVWRARIGGD
jgi:tetratricopeptide (TPR) repeat protein/predicted Ser/Thr protein kinase